MMRNNLIFYMLVVINTFGFQHPLPEVIKIGGIFESFDDDSEMAFRYAVDNINTDAKLLPKSKISAKTERIKPQSSFHASKAVCALLKEGAVAIFGPSSRASSALVRSVTSTLHIPHFEVRPVFHRESGNYTVNLYPHLQLLSKAICDLVRSKHWKSFVIIYEEDDDLVRLQELIKLRNSGIIITLRQYTGESPYNKILKEIKKKGETNMVIHVPTARIKDVMEEAQKAEMLTNYHDYVFVTLDFHTLNFSGFEHCRSNISSFRMVDPVMQYYAEDARRWTFGDFRNKDNLRNENAIKTEAALLVDAVYFFANGLDQNRSIIESAKTINCNSAHPWPYGENLIRYLRERVNFKGLTYDVQVDKAGERSRFSIDVLKLNRSSRIQKIADWNPVRNLTFTKNYTKEAARMKDDLMNIILKVTSIESNPYTMKKDGLNLSGNDRYEGFCVDLMKEICKRLKCSFEYRLVADGNYGSSFVNGSWNGMIGEVIKREADLAIADLTITVEREAVVDFTMPFMHLGISILFKKPVKGPPSLFSFLQPFSFEVWVYMATAYLGVSLLLFVLARISPYEWVSPHPCNPRTQYLENTFSLLNSFWFTIGSLMQQGSDIAPRATSTRTVAALWWFFTLIMISSYTANLAAVLTTERMKSPIEGAEDLSNQNDVKYGCVSSGSTRHFFQKSRLEPFKRMWTVMEETHPSVFAEKNSQGVERVRKGNYAFFMESTSIDYNVERNCDLIQIGGNLDSKGYGIATPPGSPYRAMISSQILKLQEEGVIHKLKETWWKEIGGGKCNVDEKQTTTSGLGLPYVCGVFVVLIIGLIISAAIAVVEFIWRTKKIPREERRTIFFEMLYELKDICMCRGSSRPPPNYLNGDTNRDSTDNGFVLNTAASFNTVSGSSQDYLS